MIASILLGLVLPSIARGATFAQARAELRARNLNPPPLFPTQLPASHRGVNVYLGGFTGVDYSIEFGAPDNADCHTLPNPYGWCVAMIRNEESLEARLHDRGNPAEYLRRMRIGNRQVWFFEDGGNAGGWWMVWREQGRTYVTAARRSLTSHRVGSPRAHRFLGQSLDSIDDRRSSACWNVGNPDGCQHFNGRPFWPCSASRAGARGWSAAGGW